MLPRQDVEPYRAVNTRPSVISGIGLVGVSGNDPEGVLYSQADSASERYVEASIAVGVGGDLLPIQPYLSVVINSFKLQDHIPIGPFYRGSEGLFIDVIPPGEPSGVGSSCPFRRAGLGEHGIMWDVHCTFL